MYKKQMKLQKAVCLLVLIASVLVFLYALGIMTDLYDSLYFTIRNPDKPERNPVAGAMIYYDMQDFNKQFLHLSIALILAAVLLYITSTHIRRRYYIGNICAVAISAIANVAVAIWASGKILAFKAQYLNEVDFAALKDFADKRHTFYTESTFWFDVHYLVFGIAILANVLLIANLIWKFRLMKEETGLIEAGKGAAA